MVEEGEWNYSEVIPSIIGVAFFVFFMAWLADTVLDSRQTEKDCREYGEVLGTVTAEVINDFCHLMFEDGRILTFTKNNIAYLLENLDE